METLFPRHGHFGGATSATEAARRGAERRGRRLESPGWRKWLLLSPLALALGGGGLWLALRPMAAPATFTGGDPDGPIGDESLLCASGATAAPSQEDTAWPETPAPALFEEMPPQTMTPPAEIRPVRRAQPRRPVAAEPDNEYLLPGEAPLDADTLLDEIYKNQGGLRAAYERALRRNPSAGGRVGVSFTVKPDGTVRGVALEGDRFGDPILSRQLRETIQRWHFPPPAGGAVQVTYPLVFRPVVPQSRPCEACWGP